MAYATVYNPTDTPVVSDGEGRTIGGRTWGVVDTTSDAGRRALEGGRLIETDPAGTGHPDAVAAAERAKAISERADRFGDADKAKLLEAARGAGLVGPDDEPHKPELVAMLSTRTELEVDLGSTRRRKAAADSTDTQEA